MNGATPVPRSIDILPPIFATPSCGPPNREPQTGVFLFFGLSYFYPMNELLDLHSNQWKLIILPRKYRTRLLIAIAQLAEHSPLKVLDCGRQYDSSIVARAARGREEIMDRIQIQRAFICYEVVKLLERTPTGHAPTIVLDLLSTFYDENVQIGMRQFLLQSALLHIQRLSYKFGVFVSIDFPPNTSNELSLFEQVRSAASQVLAYETPADASQQLRLF